MTATVSGLRPGRSLVDDEMFERLVLRVAIEEDTNKGWAVRVVDQALAFLGACAVSAQPLSPSDAVDPGWHAFVLHTQEYAAFCEKVAGRFIHHVPVDEDEAAHGAEAKSVIQRTVEEIRRAGFVVDDELWNSAPGDCSQCHQGCTDSPRRSAQATR